MMAEQGSLTGEEGRRQDDRSTAEGSRQRRVVVGVDGSSGSLAALRFALTEGQLREAEVHAVCTWEHPVTYGAPVVLPDNYDPAGEAGQILSEAIGAATEDTATATVDDVTPVVAQGPAARVLIEAAADAELLVVGTRGRGGFAALLLGSVSSQCVHHAPCPVVVVPEEAGSSSRVGGVQ